MVAYQLAQVLSRLVDFYEWLVIIWCLMTWLPLREGSFVYDVAVAINRLVAPFLQLFRRFVPSVMGIDFSPILAMVVLEFAQRLILNLGYSLF